MEGQVKGIVRRRRARPEVEGRGREVDRKGRRRRRKGRRRG